MIKIDVVRKVAQQLKLKDAEALAVVDAIIEALKETICEHGRLEVRDFGVFQVKERKPRVGRNPRNLQEYPIPPRKVVTFKLGKDLRDFAAAKSGPSKLIAKAAGDGSAPEPMPAPADTPSEV